MSVAFGTDGWRAIISDEFTFENVRQVAQAIADWVLTSPASDETTGDRTMVVGFDTRFLSDRFANTVASVFNGNGIRVYLASSDAPTPAISHAIVRYGASGGVMITASHNPPRYNGLKVKSPWGSSVGPEVGRQVVDNLRANESSGRAPRVMDRATAEQEGMLDRFDPYPEYADHLRTLVDFEAFKNCRLRVLVDPMYGSGRGYLRKLLTDAGMEVDEIHGELNPGFGGLHPEPIGRHLNSLREAVQSGLWDMGLATDGDADRIGAVDSRGRFVDPHRIFALALRYLVEKRGQTGAVVKTVSTTQMINRLAERYGLAVHETPVGFNFISDLMLSEKVLIGGEESGGISVLGHIPEGDGVLMGLLLTEIVAASGCSLDDIVADLLSDVGPSVYQRQDVKVPPDQPYDKQEMVDRLASACPETLAGQDVAEVNTRDGVKYVLGNDGWLLIRPSGTEPVLRIYAEGGSQDEVQALLRAGASLAGITEAY